MGGELHREIRSELDANRVVLEATLYSRKAGMTEITSQMLATAVSELVRNILKYAGQGEIRLRIISGPDGDGI